MKVSFEVHEIVRFSVYNTFFTSGGNIDKALLMEGFIKSSKLSRMSIWWAFHSVPNIDRHFGNCGWVCLICPGIFPICIHTHLTQNWGWKHKLKVIIRNKKIKVTFILGPLLSKWIGVFRPLLDCFSIGGLAFIQDIYFFIFRSLCMLWSIG